MATMSKYSLRDATVDTSAINTQFNVLEATYKAKWQTCEFEERMTSTTKREREREREREKDFNKLSYHLSYNKSEQNLIHCQCQTKPKKFDTKNPK